MNNSVVAGNFGNEEFQDDGGKNSSIYIYEQDAINRQCSANSLLLVQKKQALLAQRSGTQLSSKNEETEVLGDDSQADRASIVRFQGDCHYNDSSESPLLRDREENRPNQGELVTPVMISSAKIRNLNQPELS